MHIGDTMNYPYRYSLGATVSGAIMSAIFNHYRREDVIDSLRAHNLDSFDAEGWYPVDQFIDLLAEWAREGAAMTNYVSVGMAMIYHLDLPDEIEDLSSIEKLRRLGEFFMARHSGPGTGQFTAKAHETTITYTESTVWPDDIIYGYIYGAAQRYLGRGTHFVLRYAEGHQRQEMGGASTVLHLDWE